MRNILHPIHKYIQLIRSIVAIMIMFAHLCRQGFTAATSIISSISTSITSPLLYIAALVQTQYK